MPSWFHSKSSPKNVKKTGFENILDKLKHIRDDSKAASRPRHSLDSGSDRSGGCAGSRSPTSVTSICPIIFDDNPPTQAHPLPCALPLASGRTDSGKDVHIFCAPSLPLPSPERLSNTEDVVERDGRVYGYFSGSTSSLSSQESMSVTDGCSNNGPLDVRVSSSRTSHGDAPERFEQNGFGITQTAVSPWCDNLNPISPLLPPRVSSSPARAYSGNYEDAAALPRNVRTANSDSPSKSPRKAIKSDQSLNPLCRGMISPERSPVPSPGQRSPGPSLRIPNGPVSPRHPRQYGPCQDSPTGRHDNGAHPLPLPPGSPTVSSVAATGPSSGSFRSPGRVERPANLTTGWRKGSLLGKGTFGHVYTGFHSETGQSCAIKEVVIIPDNEKSRESARQLMQEVSLLSQMKHPNIVQYYGSEMIDDRLYIYLEFMSNGSIHKLIQEYGPLEESCIRVYTRQILNGLCYLHGKNTVHRDIKGANILVDKGGVVKLADFGMAKHISAEASPLSFKGSPYWMAPEVIRNTNGYDFAVDIWSLGCTVLEMANGKPPWSQLEGIQALFKIGNSKEIPAMPEFLSNDGKSFIASCLQRAPYRRPTAAQLLDHPFVNTQLCVSEVVTSNMQKLSMMESKCQPRTLSQVGNTCVSSSTSVSVRPAGHIAHHNVTSFAPSSPLTQISISPRSGANGSSPFHGDGMLLSSPMHEVLGKSPRSPKSYHVSDMRNHSDIRTEACNDRSHIPSSTPPHHRFSIWDKDISVKALGGIPGDGGDEHRRLHSGNVHGIGHISQRFLRSPQHYDAILLQPGSHNTLGRARSHEFCHFAESRYRV